MTAYVETGSATVWASQLLKHSAHQAAGRLFISDRATGEKTWVDTEWLAAQHYPSLRPTASGMKYFLKVYTLGCMVSFLQHWWELRLLPGPLGLEAGKQSSCRWVLDHWANWSSTLGSCFPEHALLRKRISREKKHSDYAR